MEGFHMDGVTQSAYAGVDYRMQNNVLIGLAGTYATGSIDYESSVNGSGTLNTRLFSALPYVQFSPADGLTLWGMGGFGTGTAELMDVDAMLHESPLAMQMGTGGVRQRIGRVFAVKADAFWIGMTTDETSALSAVDAQASRLRVAPELTGHWRDGTSVFKAGIEVGGRLDGGDAEKGIGAEAGGVLGYAHAGSGIRVDIRGRMLLAHEEEDFRDWGVSTVIGVQRQDQGLTLLVRPEWGNPGSSMRSLMEENRFMRAASGTHAATSGTLRPGRMRVEAGYVVPVYTGGQLEPFARYGTTGLSAWQLQSGMRLVLPKASQLKLEIYAERYAPGPAVAEYAVGLRGVMGLFRSAAQRDQERSSATSARM